MTEHTDNGLNLGNFVFDDNNQERQAWKCFDRLVIDLWCFFVPIFFYFVNISVVYSKNNSCRNL